MESKKINPILKIILELGPIIIFFVGYGKIKNQLFAFGGQEYEGFIVATALFIPLILMTTGILWILTGKLSKMQLVTALLVVVLVGLEFGSMTSDFLK